MAPRIAAGPALPCGRPLCAGARPTGVHRATPILASKRRCQQLNSAASSSQLRSDLSRLRTPRAPRRSSGLQGQNCARSRKTRSKIREMESQRIFPASPAEQIKEEWTPDESGEEPYRNLRRGEDGARQRVGQDQENGTRYGGNGQEPNVGWTQDQPCDVGND